MYQYVSTCSTNGIVISIISCKILITFYKMGSTTCLWVGLLYQKIQVKPLNSAVFVVTHDHFTPAWLVAIAPHFILIFIFFRLHGGPPLLSPLPSVLLLLSLSASPWLLLTLLLLPLSLTLLVLCLQKSAG